MSGLVEPVFAEDGSSGLRYNFHPGQYEAWHSTARFPIVCAGTQGGKTSFAPLWLDREIQTRGAGDYLAISATYDLFKLKMLPEFWAHFVERRGWKYLAGDRVFVREGGEQPARIILRSADAPGGLESATALGAVFDEPGQPQVQAIAWEATQRRLSLAQGRCLFLTTLYTAGGWFVQQVLRRAIGGDSDYHLIAFPSYYNPAFPVEEYVRARETLPAWKFALFYQGILTKPSGLIYSDFNDWLSGDARDGLSGHLCKPFTIPKGWKRHVGVDHGPVNTAILWIAEEPDTERYYVYREFLGGGMTGGEHARKCLEYNEAVQCWWGGSPSEDEARVQWQLSGVPLARPVIDGVEPGIEQVIGLFKTRRLFVFESMHGLRSELNSYSRELDDAGEPTEKIADKQKYHRIDALRYGCSAFPMYRHPRVPHPQAPATDRLAAAAMVDKARERRDKRTERAIDDYV